jgi:hypothetical protein
MNRPTIAVLAFFITFSVTVSASGNDEQRVERGPALPGLYAGLAGLQALDIYTTSRGLAGGAREGNPLLRGVAGNPAAMLIVKGSVTAASIAVSERLWKQHRRRRAIATMIATNGIMAAVAARNLWLLRQPSTRSSQ